MWYDMSMTIVVSIEKISSYLTSRLGLPRRLTSAALYGLTNALKLPFQGLMKEFKVIRTRKIMCYMDSNDSKMDEVGIEFLRHHKKFIAEERLKYKSLVETVAIVQTGLGYYHNPRRHRVTNKERQHLLQEEVRASYAELRLAKLVSLGQQDAWTNGKAWKKRKVSWSDTLTSSKSGSLSRQFVLQYLDRRA